MSVTLGLTTIAYRPVTVNGKHLWTAYIIYPHAHTTDAVFLLEQQRNFSIVVIEAIGVAAMMIACLVLMHNRRLELIVKQKHRSSGRWWTRSHRSTTS